MAFEPKKRAQLRAKETHSPTPAQLTILIGFLELISASPLLKAGSGIQFHPSQCIILLSLSLEKAVQTYYPENSTSYREVHIINPTFGPAHIVPMGLHIFPPHEPRKNYIGDYEEPGNDIEPKNYCVLCQATLGVT